MSSSRFPVDLRRADAASFTSSIPFDLVLANSAYHHIPDGHKVDFLKTARALVAEDGAILVGEHFLPPYKTSNEFRESVISFYTELIGELLTRGEPAPAIDVIRRSALY